jgi:hypothetical protein
MLDDERLCVPALHRNDYLPGSDYTGLQSAEVVRFMGYLVRELKALGDSLIFNVDSRDPAPKIKLEKFFTELFKRGALRGRREEDAFTITNTSVRDNEIAFDIFVAPAYPIDSIQITFVNKQGNWLAQATPSLRAIGETVA